MSSDESGIAEQGSSAHAPRNRLCSRATELFHNPGSIDIHIFHKLFPCSRSAEADEKSPAPSADPLVWDELLRNVGAPFLRYMCPVRKT